MPAKFLFFISRFLILLVLIKGGALAASAPEPDRTQRLIEGAKQEGELNIWSIGDMRAQNELVEGFKRKYPFIKKVQAIRPQSFRTRNRLLAEARAGKASEVDVVGLISFDMVYVAENSLLMPYKSPETQAVAEGFRDANGHWTAFFVNPKVTAYNTNLVAARDLPRKWEDLLTPNWRGKIALYREDYGWFSNFLKIAGRERGLAFMRQLARQDLQLRDGHTLMVQLLAAGEFPLISVAYAPRISLTKSEGAPVDWVALDPVFGEAQSIAIYAKAKHPNAAKLYVDYVLSREVQQEVWVNRYWKHSARPDVVAKDSRWKSIKVIPLDLMLTKELARTAEEFRQIFESKGGSK
ncbi:MAG: extracellular solute-binding protein [Deltaproteobacteria bacterium]|nr:extracellular solute-binding protein [Deltaproteobacteria bacterium]